MFQARHFFVCGQTGNGCPAPLALQARCSACLQVIPHSVTFIGGADEGGGGNRISEEQIKTYLDSILGEAPRPDWGVPQGWGAYISGVQSAGREEGEGRRLSRGAADRHDSGCCPSYWGLSCCSWLRAL